jgi:outer membrane protein assembly factor BamB
MLAATAAFCLMSVAAFAADASGTWKWTEQSGRGGGGGGGTPREVTLTLAQKDGKVTGKISRPGRDGAVTATDISDASIKGDTIAFSLERTFGDNKIVTKYSGKLAGDTITGTSESPGRNGGEATKREWVAKRSK